jgi:2,4-dienoyl-CoA reductase (NADPH2)
MFNGQRTQCVINPALGQEKRAEEARRPAPVRKRVLIAGAGPAGCEAALLAAARGHDVEIAECRDRIGGQLHAWGAASTFRAEIANLIAFYEGELQRSGVTVRLGTAVESLDLAGYDHVLLATGTVTADTGIDAVAMLDSGEAPAADEVTVFGATETALFAALWLAEQGKRTTLVSPVEGVGVDSNDMESGHLAGQLDALGVTVLTNTPDPGGPDIVRATARTASDAVELAVDGERVRAVGSRLRGGRMYEATQSGFWAAAQI